MFLTRGLTFFDIDTLFVEDVFVRDYATPIVAIGTQVLMDGIYFQWTRADSISVECFRSYAFRVVFYQVMTAKNGELLKLGAQARESSTSEHPNEV